MITVPEPLSEIDAWLGETGRESDEYIRAQSYLDAAAVVASYAPETLVPLDGDRADRDACINMLLETSRPVETNSGPRWRLDEAARAESLRRLAAAGDLHRAMTLNPGDPSDALQVAFTAFLAGLRPSLEGASLDELIAARVAASWAQPVIGSMDIRELDVRIERERLLEPMRALSNESFIGRKKELQILADYVGVLPPDTATQWIQRSIKDVRRRFSPTPPLYISGPGGMGKSTLLAHFVLQHADRPDPVPIVYLDFDRPSLNPSRPLTVLAEAVRQLLVQFPRAQAGASGLGLEIAAADNALESDSLFRSRHFARGDDLARRFAEFVSTIQSFTPHPTILLLDTFEQAQRQGDSQVEVFWSLMDRLAYTGLPIKIVAAGRGALPGHLQHEALPLGPLSQPEAIELLRAKVSLGGAGSLQQEDAREVISLVGAAPLNVTLAARVLALEGLKGLRETRRRRRLFQKIAAEEHQGILQARILGHLGKASPDLGRLVDPGLIVRRLTPDVIRIVLAGPCALGDIDRNRADELYQALVSQAGLVDSHREHGAVWHIPHVRSAMLPLLIGKLGERATAIHRAAVAYYRDEKGPIARAEEVYHRLWLGEEPDDRWEDSIRGYLANALDDFDDHAKLWLADRLGVEVDKAVRWRASLLDWERQTEIRARTLMAAGLLDGALAAFSERVDRSDSSPLFAMEADARILTADLEGARAVIEAGLEAMSAGRRPDLVLALLQRGAVVEERLGHVSDAKRFASDAVEQARATGDRALIFVARVAEYRLARLDGVVIASVLANMRDRLARSVSSDLIDRLRTMPGALEDAASEIGTAAPELVFETLRMSGLDRHSLIQTLEDEVGDARLEDALQLDHKAAEHMRDLVWRRSGVSTGRLGEELLRLLLDSQDRPDLLEFVVRAISLSADATRRQSLARGLAAPGRHGINRKQVAQLSGAIAAELSASVIERVMYSVFDRQISKLTPSSAGSFSDQVADILLEASRRGQLAAFLEALVRQRELSPPLRASIDHVLERL
jgi:hypothetical protein